MEQKWTDDHRNIVLLYIKNKDDYIFKISFNGYESLYISSIDKTFQKLISSSTTSSSMSLFFQKEFINLYIDDDMYRDIGKKFLSYIIHNIIVIINTFPNITYDKNTLSYWMHWLNVSGDQCQDWPFYADVMSLTEQSKNDYALATKKLISDLSHNNINYLSQIWKNRTSIANQIKMETIQMAPFIRGYYYAMKRTNVFPGWNELIMSKIQKPDISPDDYFSEMLWNRIIDDIHLKIIDDIYLSMDIAIDITMNQFNPMSLMGMINTMIESIYILKYLNAHINTLRLFKRLIDIDCIKDDKWISMYDLTVSLKMMTEKIFVNIESCRSLYRWNEAYLSSTAQDDISQMIYAIYSIIAFSGRLSVLINICLTMYGKSWTEVIYHNMKIDDMTYDDFIETTLSSMTFESDVKTNCHIQTLNYYYYIQYLFQRLNDLISFSSFNLNDINQTIVSTEFPKTISSKYIHIYHKCIGWISNFERGIDIFTISSSTTSSQIEKSKQYEHKRPEMIKWLQIAQGHF